MAHASLTITVPNDVWIGEVSRTYPDATFLVRSARSAGGVGVAFVELSASDPAAVLDAIADRDAVHDVEPFHREDERVLVQIEAENPVLLDVLERTGAPVEMPFEIADGEVEWSVTTTRNRLSTLASALTDSEIGYVLDHVRERTEFDSVLTDTQQRTIEAALDLGYYDSPRRCTQEDLAAHLDMAKSTCSETLHRAEERIVKEFDGGQPKLTELRQTA